MNLEALNHNIELHERLAWAYEMRESLQEKSNLQAVKMDGMPHGSDISDNVGNISIAIADLDSRIDKLEDELEESDSKVREYANSFEDERLQQIIQLRFISCLTWGMVAELLGPKFSEETVKYLAYNNIPNPKRKRKRPEPPESP